MKSNNKFSFFLLIMLVGLVLSCNDEIPRDNNETIVPDERVSIESDNEALYRYQTNKEIILHSLIQYDENKQIYFLDASEKDIEKLGISSEAYQDGLLRVEQLNQINIERQ
ncbi:hypothetical protein [Proteiniphilum sp. X52]|jgi:hypothetical protein|uniref:hypothetical protein n=1 Tax=Proteiniphilum sp. X52 TaxID=2382159 RepID=UPI000F0A5D3D|nr:hypothetical protein [Proteiniphilum sp. X52]RNC66051.1 hypothetical protein D7D25_03660 [Proteiniphilum sp. X52]